MDIPGVWGSPQREESIGVLRYLIFSSFSPQKNISWGDYNEAGEGNFDNKKHALLICFNIFHFPVGDEKVWILEILLF